jgi:5-methylcytosine-specific restriction endonuclease McrA
MKGRIKGSKLSEEHKKRIGDALRGRRGMSRPISEETRQKMSKSKKGFKHSEEAKRKISIGHKGKTLSNETKNKISNSLRGKKAPNWQGGISFSPYSIDWTNSLRISIRERDKYTCQLCGEKQGDIAHHVHHIDYNKLNCSSDNLITLCKSCHSKTTNKREYWIKYFN